MVDRKEICVVGSVNTDLHAVLERFPAAGETLRARSFAVSGGGKGANQAVALARLGARAFLVGKVGRDAFGRDRRADLRASGLDVSLVGEEPGLPSGVALVETEAGGQNRIVVVEGANGAVDAAWVEAAGARIGGASLALFQLELPMAAVLRGLELARAGGAVTILDPAPAGPIPTEAFGLVDYLTPNETEAEALVGFRPEGADGCRAAAEALLRRGARRVVLKAGGEGACLFGGDGLALRCPAFPVSAVDTTAAGDAFNAGLAAALAEGKEPAEALRFACAVGALATTRHGAQESLPSRAEVERLLAERPGIVARRI